MINWTDGVRAGDLAAIPVKLDFNEAGKLALMVDGYRLAGGVAACQNLANPIIEEVRRTGGSKARVRELWIALFWHQRYYRVHGTEPTGKDLVVWNKHVKVLRAALCGLTPHEMALIMTIIVPKEPEPQEDLKDG